MFGKMKKKHSTLVVLALSLFFCTAQTDSCLAGLNIVSTSGDTIFTTLIHHNKDGVTYPFVSRMLPDTVYKKRSIIVRYVTLDFDYADVGSGCARPSGPSYFVCKTIRKPKPKKK